MNLDVPKGLIGLDGWMSTTPDGTSLLLRDLRAAEIYAVDEDLPLTFARGVSRLTGQVFLHRVDSA